MPRQIDLFPKRRGRSIRSIVEERMLGFELRQKQRTAKRIAQRQKYRRKVDTPEQTNFWTAGKESN